MIEELYIRHVGGIEEATLKFAPGFVVITGESGSGKSSIVRAMELISGKRASKGSIKSGCNEATVRAIFDHDKPLLLENCSLDEDLLFIQRSIFREKKGKALIQDRLSPLSTVTTISDQLLTIQSQFAQLELLDQDKQLQILDICGGKELLELKSHLRDQVKVTIQKERELLKLKQRQKNVIDKFQGAEEIVHRWKKLDISTESEKEWEDEYSRLSIELRRMNESKDTLQRLKNEAPDSFKEELEGITDRIKQNVSAKNRKKLLEHVNELLECYQNIVEILDGETDEQIRIETENTLEELESRMGALRKLKRTAGVRTLTELIDYCSEANTELEWLKKSNKTKNSIEDIVENSRKSASRMALELRKLRHQSASWLEKRVNRCLEELAMSDNCFSANLIEQTKLRQNGADMVEFRLSWGNGVPGPVAKMASGGELSRILLAIKLSLPDQTLPPTIVFDEVEAGLGGRAAVLAGKKLKALSQRNQVILITHEASIAALADQHLLANRVDSTTFFKELTKEDRVSELARMLSGDYDLDEARSHASRLLQIK